LLQDRKDYAPAMDDSMAYAKEYWEEDNMIKVVEGMEGCLLQDRKDHAPAVDNLVGNAKESWKQDSREWL
jgi:hypothetical protein